MFNKRKLTEDERKTINRYKRDIYFPPEETFEAGFSAGLDYQQVKLNIYAAYVAGKITMAELEEALK